MMIFWQKKFEHLVFFIFVCFLLLPSSQLNAARRIVNNDLLEFSLSIEHQNTHFNFPSSHAKTSFDLLGINWYEPFSSSFHGGLEVGYLEMTQAENSVSSAKFSSGQYMGLLLRFLLIDNPHLTFDLNLNYRYNSSEGNTVGQRTEFAWYEGLFSAEMQFHLSENSQLLLAGEFHLLDGEQRDSGSINQITDFSETKQKGYRLGLNFKTNRKGVLGVEWLAGFRDGGRIYFRRYF